MKKLKIERKNSRKNSTAQGKKPETKRIRVLMPRPLKEAVQTAANARKQSVSQFVEAGIRKALKADDPAPITIVAAAKSGLRGAIYKKRKGGAKVVQTGRAAIRVPQAKPSCERRVRINVRLPRALRQAVDKGATKLGITPSRFVEQAVRENISRIEAIGSRGEFRAEVLLLKICRLARECETLRAAYRTVKTRAEKTK